MRTWTTMLITSLHYKLNQLIILMGYSKCLSVCLSCSHVQKFSRDLSVSWEEQLVINEHLSYFTDNPNTILFFEVMFWSSTSDSSNVLCSYWIFLKIWKRLQIGNHVILDGIMWRGLFSSLLVVMATRTLIKSADCNFIGIHKRSVNSEYHH